MADWTQNIGNYVSRLWKDQGDGTHAPRVSLAANSGVDIGDVDVTSTVHPAGISTIAHGERAGSATAVQLATVAAKYVRLKARVANTGSVWVGSSNAVTKGAGTTTTTCGFQLAAGEDTGWLPATNLNLFWIICDNATDHLTYMVAN